jgi:hypothetical protein
MTLLDGVVSEGSEQKPADPRDPIVRLEALLDEARRS